MNSTDATSKRRKTVSKVVIFDTIAKKWWKAPLQGLTDKRAEAHAYTQAEAKHELSMDGSRKQCVLETV